MRKLILQMQTSVDGRVASDDGEPWQVWGWGDNDSLQIGDGVSSVIPRPRRVWTVYPGH